MLQDSSAIATYAYDSQGRLSGVGRLTGSTTISSTYGYDGADRLRDLRLTSGTGANPPQIGRFEYGLDRLGLRTVITETLPLSGTTTPTNTPTATATSATATTTATASNTASGATATHTATATTTPTPTATPTTGSGGCVFAVDGSAGAYIEAESASTIAGTFQVVSDVTRSNGAYADTPTGSSTDGSVNYLAFNLNVTNGGNLNVYLLSTGPSGAADSVYVQADATPQQQVTTGSTGTWVWKKPSGTFSLANGAHTLYVRVREPGAQVDKLFITSGSTAPIDLGGTATGCGGSGGGGGGALLMRCVSLAPSATPTRPISTTAAHTVVYLPLVVQVTNTNDGTTSGGPTRLSLGAPQTRVTTYQYDGVQRLVGATELTGGTTSATYVYAYDLAGNRTSASANGTTTSYQYNAANQVTSVNGGAGWSYDLAGNLLSDGSPIATYDALSRVTQRNGTTYSYNGDGTLISQATGGVTTRYQQDLAAPLSQVLALTQGAGAPTRYLYGHARLASLSGGARTWYGSDALGSVRLTLDDSGTGQGAYRYDPWGSLRDSATAPTFGFTGELHDAAGLVYLRARWPNWRRAPGIAVRHPWHGPCPSAFA